MQSPAETTKKARLGPMDPAPDSKLSFMRYRRTTTGRKGAHPLPRASTRGRRPRTRRRSETSIAAFHDAGGPKAEPRMRTCDAFRHPGREHRPRVQRHTRDSKAAARAAHAGLHRTSTQCESGSGARVNVGQDPQREVNGCRLRDRWRGTLAAVHSEVARAKRGVLPRTQRRSRGPTQLWMMGQLTMHSTTVPE